MVFSATASASKAEGSTVRVTTGEDGTLTAGDTTPTAGEGALSGGDPRPERDVLHLDALGAEGRTGSQSSSYRPNSLV